MDALRGNPDLLFENEVYEPGEFQINDGYQIALKLHFPVGNEIPTLGTSINHHNLPG